MKYNLVRFYLGLLLSISSSEVTVTVSILTLSRAKKTNLGQTDIKNIALRETPHSWRPLRARKASDSS